MPKLTIDGTEVEGAAGHDDSAGLRARRDQGRAFLLHERLAIAGNCRMCLVEVGNTEADSFLCRPNVSQLTACIFREERQHHQFGA
jgi:NADH dehydrogenase/NADH:ubiquinone oxidoreductase subunit G